MPDLTRLGDLVDELTSKHKVETPIYGWTPSRHRKMTAVKSMFYPPLLDQLADCVRPHGGQTDDEGGGRRVPSSRAPLDLDALDRLVAIEHGVNRWRQQLGMDSRGDVKRDLRGLVGAVTRTTSTQVDELTSEASTWWRWCRTVAGWDSAPWRPHAPCLACDKRGGLRVRLDQQTACCVACGAAWGADNIGLLARHIEAVTSGRQGAA